MSKILSAEQLREADRKTIQNEPISSTDLMERAATAAYKKIRELYTSTRHYTIFCGVGNNGGDGLVIARLLVNSGYHVDVHIIQFSNSSTSDFNINLDRFKMICDNIRWHSTKEKISIDPNSVIIDSLLGTGVTRKLDGVLAHFVQVINNADSPVVSIDLPSGIYNENNCDDNRSVAIEATYTLSFQTIKYCFLIPENKKNIGVWSILDIGLDRGYVDSVQTSKEAVDFTMANAILRARNSFSHKGDFGHALICSGSKNMMGAAVMSTRSCLRSGAGLVSAFVPECGYEIMQSSVPEVMTICSSKENTLYSHSFDLKYDAIGIGPGIGTSSDCQSFIESIFNSGLPSFILDADALNILSMNTSLLDAIPEGSIITPHPKEFDRLFGPHNETNDRIATGIKEANKRGIYIILKGHHTVTITPLGKCFFNLSGNPGMATGGSGDVLTGILTGLCAQHYSAESACILGVFLHGLAGDIAVKQTGEEALIASDIIEQIGTAFKVIHQE